MAFPWYALAVLFLLPFFDPRRPFRLLHLDLLVLIVIGVRPLQRYLELVVPGRSVILTVLGLAYLFGRLLWLGFRPSERRGRLIPLVPLSWLAIAVVLLAGFRLWFVLSDQEQVVDVGVGQVIDVGVASAVGADRLTHGGDLYDGGLGELVRHGDTYGPVTYLSYVPFEQVFPLRRRARAPDYVAAVGSNYRDQNAARSAAIAFDTLTLFGLFLLGRRLRPGSDGRVLGVALAFAWVSYPYSLLVLRWGFNDSLVALAVVATLLALASPAGRGILAALAAATKFAPAVLAPLLAVGTGERRLRSLLIFTVAFIAVLVVVFLPFVPDGGLKELYDRTLGFQEKRAGFVAIWGQVPSLGWLQTLLHFALGGLALLVAFVPRRRTPLQVMALGGALLVALEVTGTNWFPTYAVWFVPLAFPAFLGAYGHKDRVARPTDARDKPPGERPALAQAVRGET